MALLGPVFTDYSKTRNDEFAKFCGGVYLEPFFHLICGGPEFQVFALFRELQYFVSKILTSGRLRTPEIAVSPAFCPRPKPNRGG